MAVPSYTADLIDICLCETGDTFFEFSGYALGDGADLETDWYIQGSQCASDENNNKTGVGHSIGFDYGSAVSYTAGDHFLIWMYYLAPNAPDSYANGGYRVLIGSSSSNFGVWYVGGNNFGRNPFGGWQNFAVDPARTVDSGSQPSTSTMQFFGAGFNVTTGTLKGRPVSCDAMRFGRGDYSITNGSLADGYATFAGLAADNDNQSNVYGLFQGVAGGYLWKGKISFGTSTTAVDFRDANKVITIDDTPKANVNFNRMEVSNTASIVSWNSINISAPPDSVSGSVISPGSLEIIDNANVSIVSCTFTDMDTFIFQANTILDRTTFRRCNQITQGDSTITDCLIASSVANVAVVASNTDLITGTQFNNSANIALSIPSSVTGSINFDGNTFEGNVTDVYWAGTSGLLTINLVNGASATTWDSAGGNVEFQTAVSFAITNVIDETEIRIIRQSDLVELAGAENVGAIPSGLNNVTVSADPDNAGRYVMTYSYSYGGSDVPIFVYAHNVDYLWIGFSASLRSTSQSLQIFQTQDRQYDRGTTFTPS